MYPRIIGLGHRKQTGKDTIGGILHDLYGYEKVSFARPIKDLAYAATKRQPIPSYYSDVIEVGEEQAKLKWENRVFLQDLGEAAREVIHEEIWVEAAFYNAPKHKNIVITDLRFPNEFAKIKSLGGQVWRVERPGLEVSTDPHISETALNNHVFDENIVNDGSVRDLAEKVMSLMDGYRNGGFNHMQATRMTSG